MAKQNNLSPQTLPCSFDGKAGGQLGILLSALFALILPLLPAGGLYVLSLSLYELVSAEILLAIQIAVYVFAGFFLLLGLAWASVVVMRWNTRHTVIGGNRLRFTGKTFSLWGNYIKWLFLTVITVLIYGLWVGIKFRQWKLSNTVVIVEGQTQPLANAMQTGMPMPQVGAPTQQPFGFYPPFPVYPPFPYGNNQNTKD